MIRDILDDLLDRSTPAVRSAAQVDLNAMIADAGQAAPRTFRPRVVITAGLAVVLASGGVGFAAVATDGFSWAPWAQDPIGAVQFSMENGFQCELRFSAYTAGDDPTYVNEVNGILEHWYQSADVLVAVQALVPAALEEIGPIELQEGETLETLPPGEAQHREWAREWLAWEPSAMRNGRSLRAMASSPEMNVSQALSEAGKFSVATRTTSFMCPGLGRETDPCTNHIRAERVSWGSASLPAAPSGSG